MSDPAGLHIVLGPDERKRTEAIRQTVDRFTDVGTKDFNYDRFSGRSVTPEQLSSTLGTPPMMAAFRLVHVEEAEALDKDVLAILESHFESAGPADVAVLLVYGTNKKPPKSLEKLATEIYRSAALSWREAEQWLIEESEKRYGRRLSSGVAKELVQILGPKDSGLLANELATLHALAGDAPICAAMVRELLEARGEASIWEFCDQVGSRNGPAALQTLDELLRLPSWDGVGILSILTGHLAKIAAGVAAQESGASKAQIKKAMGGDWKADKSLSQVERWNLAEIDRTFSLMLDADLDLKLGADDRVTLSSLVHQSASPKLQPANDISPVLSR